MKHRLSSLLGDGYDSSLTEYNNMITNGFHRIWDCGHILYQYNKNKSDNQKVHAVRVNIV